MSDQKRKIGKIVFDRPPLRWGRFFLFAGLGLLIGGLVGGGFWLGLTGHSGGEVPDVLYTKQCSPYFVPCCLVGLLAGVIFGWGWKRATTARIEMVNPPRVRRRDSTSTAIARLDISGRSRY